MTLLSQQPADRGMGMRTCGQKYADEAGQHNDRLIQRGRRAGATDAHTGLGRSSEVRAAGQGAGGEWGRQEEGGMLYRVRVADGGTVSVLSIRMLSNSRTHLRTLS